LAAALVGPDVATAAPAWDYAKDGADWGTISGVASGCAAAGQSPIDLQSSAERVAAAKDDYQSVYLNVKDVKIEYGATS